MTNEEKEDVKRLKQKGLSIIEIIAIFRDKGSDAVKDDIKQEYNKA